MELFLLFDLLLTAIFSLLFAFLLSRLLSPSSPSSTASSRDAAAVTSDEAPAVASEPKEGGGGELQEEKIIEVDEVAADDKRTERGFLVQEVSSIGTDEFGGDVEVEKEKKLDDHHGLEQKDDGFEVEEEKKEEEEEGLKEVEISEIELRKDDIDDSREVEGLIDKMSGEVEVSSEKEIFLNCEIEKLKGEECNLCEVEGPIGKIVTEELIVPEEISALVMESSEPKKEEIQEEERNLTKEEGPTGKTAQLIEVSEDNKDKQKGKERAFIEEEGWEGIERTATEKRFAVAANYAASSCGGDALVRLSSDVQLQLYGLHKIATEGPCYESHPMALRTSARAKWHAWQKLGNMNPETAMEEYMNVLSKNVPNWSEQPIVDVAHNESDQLTIESGSCIEGSAEFGSASLEKGTESPASIQ